MSKELPDGLLATLQKLHDESPGSFNKLLAWLHDPPEFGSLELHFRKKRLYRTGYHESQTD